MLKTTLLSIMLASVEGFIDVGNGRIVVIGAGSIDLQMLESSNDSTRTSFSYLQCLDDQISSKCEIAQ